MLKVSYSISGFKFQLEMFLFLTSKFGARPSTELLVKLVLIVLLKSAKSLGENDEEEREHFLIILGFGKPWRIRGDYITK